MIVARSLQEARQVIAGWRRNGATIGLVPTMGYFHDGHLELMRRSVEQARCTVVSLFVNPTQFGPGEDIDLYPRDFEGDCAKARKIGADLLFCPEAAAIYRPDHRTEVSVRGLSEGLCGCDRPGHFSGVATVVSKLFNIVRPDLAFFGEKDFQQLRIIRQLNEDLNYAITVVGVPIVREADGLAMSSRNAYLNASERAEAPVLYRALLLIREQALDPRGSRASAELIDRGRRLIATSPICTIDYLAIVDEDSLAPLSEVGERSRVLGAIRVNGRIRLIDNLALYR